MNEWMWRVDGDQEWSREQIDTGITSEFENVMRGSETHPESALET